MTTVATTNFLFDLNMSNQWSNPINLNSVELVDRARYVEYEHINGVVVPAVSLEQAVELLNDFIIEGPYAEMFAKYNIPAVESIDDLVDLKQDDIDVIVNVAKSCLQINVVVKQIQNGVVVSLGCDVYSDARYNSVLTGAGRATPISVKLVDELEVLTDEEKAHLRQDNRESVAVFKIAEINWLLIVAID